jgi:hypothetical protein
MEHLSNEDAYVMEIVVNKINEIIDEVNALEEHFNKRINNLWAYHRRRDEQPKPQNGEPKVERKPKLEPSQETKGD